ncbi:MAG TPA: type II toxin-antitoxin system death-on-curing family toxin [Micropepsaceae bacterium]|jgi:death-on-curing protein|nr:type II toxin-antitoxin system death-on-curing family toxin [Micropepsaceae bacterium]
MTEPVWVSRHALELLHRESLSEHGGAEGLRDSGLLDSALARARNVYAYENVTDPFRLAAAYAFGIAKNHPFVDGNKRAAFISAGLFLRLNGVRLKADKAESVLVMLDLAAGELTEAQFAEWLRRNA